MMRVWFLFANPPIGLSIFEALKHIGSWCEFLMFWRREEIGVVESFVNRNIFLGPTLLG